MVCMIILTKKEFDFISSRQRFDDIIIFDDYSKKFPDIIRLVEDIKNRKNYNINILPSSDQRSYVIAQKKMKIAIEKFPFIGNEKIGPYIFLERLSNEFKKQKKLL